MAERAQRAKVTWRGVERVRDGIVGSSAMDEVAVEEPLEIRVAGETLAVTMRTPGDDHELALGLLLSEGIIAGRDDVGRVFHCGRADDADYGNTLDVLPGPGVALAPERAAHARRGTLVSAACGVCGRQRIDDLLERCAPLPAGPALPLSSLLASSCVLRDNQQHFARTGGLHAAAVVAEDGGLLVLREDVGRHNAVDKALGSLLIAGSVPVSSTHAARAHLTTSRERISVEAGSAARRGTEGILDVSRGSATPRMGSDRPKGAAGGCEMRSRSPGAAGAVNAA